MARKKQTQSDEPAGAPEWMVTFSDCMTLLLTFFVLLLSFSSFGDDEGQLFRKHRVGFVNAMDSVSNVLLKKPDALVPTEQISSTKNMDKGSEKPTLKDEYENRQKKITGYDDFYKRCVFLYPSKQMFLGKGLVISPEGKLLLNDMADYFKRLQGPIVISESRHRSNTVRNNFSLSRAWAVVEYLTKRGLNKKRFSISVISTLGQSKYENDLPNYVNSKTESALEIVLLKQEYL